MDGRVIGAIEKRPEGIAYIYPEVDTCVNGISLERVIDSIVPIEFRLYREGYRPPPVNLNIDLPYDDMPLTVRVWIFTHSHDRTTDRRYYCHGVVNHDVNPIVVGVRAAPVNNTIIIDATGILSF